MDMDIYPGASDALQPAPLNQQREREREGHSLKLNSMVAMHVHYATIS